MANVISPQQRMLNFGAYTRKHSQMLGAQSGTAGSHIEFEVPKARLLQAINLLVEVTLDDKLTSLTSPIFDDTMNFYDVISRIAVDFNNGFSPVVGSGKDIAVMNMLRNNPLVIRPSAEDGATLCSYDNSGTKTKFYFSLEVPLTLNERDTSGLVLAQNGQTLINFACDIASTVTIATDNAGVEAIKITPEIVSFSIPTQAEAFPDLSVLKIVDSRKESFTGGGSNLVKLPTGQIYRKLIIKLEDNNGNPIEPDDITSNIELLFNTADVPYSINPKTLRLRTVSETGARLPKGYYAFDFSYQGISNYGGSRDYIDCEKLTTFELRFTCAEAGKVTIISEKISRLIASN